MNKKGPIVVIEDDLDDQALLTTVFNELNYDNEIRFFTTGDAALKYLSNEEVRPFIILSDVNMPKLNGFAVRNIVHTSEALSKKSIPYIFFSTSVSSEAVNDAYNLSAQGFFLKPHAYDKLKRTISLIVEYWKECYSPSGYF